MRLRAILGMIASGLAAEGSGATFTVTSTADSGAGTFRQAILDANTNPGADTIAFNIVGSGVQTITVMSDLPPVTDPVVIDGATQPGYAGAPLIEVTSGAPASGLAITAGSSTVRALVLNSFATHQLTLTTNGGNVVEGCYFGTDPSGATAIPGGGGILVQSSHGNTIGGTAAGSGNLVSGNYQGIYVQASNGTVIQGNRIGTTADGTAALGNNDGITLDATANTLVGGSSAGARNLISGNNSQGIFLTQPGGTITIRGNRIGTDASGTQAVPNALGIASDNFDGSLVIGGAGPGEGNLISGNEYGVVFNDGNAVVQGNLMGTDAAGTQPLPNNEALVVNTTGTHNVLIGGPDPGQGNVIAFNQSPYPSGVWNFGKRVRIQGNSIHDNHGLGIDNDAQGPEPNDPLDADTGPNEHQNFPHVTSISLNGPGGAETRIQGVLHSAPSTTYTLDFYANPACSAFPRDFLEGETYLGFGQTTTDGAGDSVFDITLPVQVAPDARITATATDPLGNTSEFSQRLVFSITPGYGPPAGGTIIELYGTDFANGAAVTIGGVPATDVNVTDSNIMHATAPALPPGTVNDVTVSNLDGTVGTLPKGWVSDFLDVPTFHLFYGQVTRLVSNAITVGVGGGNYGVAQSTLRQQMAVFLLKTKNGVCYVPPPCTGVFPDVPCSSGFAPWIEALAAQGITGGCGGGNYCPLAAVLRQQMAVFILKTKYGSSYMPPACTGVFGDVACPSPFADWIEQLAAENITGGCGGGNYCPTNPVTRGQMAAFLSIAFELQ